MRPGGISGMVTGRAVLLAGACVLGAVWELPGPIPTPLSVRLAARQDPAQGSPVPGDTAQSGAATSDTVTFAAGTQLVVQTVNVTDRNGVPIEGLTRDDFQVTENGVRQEVAFVEFQRIAADPPVVAPTRPAVAPVQGPPAVAPVAPAAGTGIAASAQGRVRYQDRRLTVLYFDLSSMPPRDQVRAYTSAGTFIDTRMTDADMVAILAFQGGAVQVRQDFTDDRSLLHLALQRLLFGDDLDGDGIPDNPDPGSAFGQNDAEFTIFNTDRQLSALQTAAGMLERLPERKALVYFSSGLRLNGADNQAQLRATINAALRANVSVHPIDARGLVAEAPLGDATVRSPGGPDALTGRLQEAGTAVRQRSQDTLFALAGDTGGRALFDANDLAAGIADAARSITSYYVVGYYSTHVAPDGRYRRVAVTLAGAREAALAYREGYFADRSWDRTSRADRERQLEDALMLENPVTDITLAVEVNHFQVSRAEYFVPVAARIAGSELALARRRGAARLVLDVVAEVKTSSGVTIQNVRDRIDVRLDTADAARLPDAPLQYETGFTLLPDDYAIKLLVRDAETGRLGTFLTTFTVPNLERVPELPVSSLVLAGQRVPAGTALFSARANSGAPATSPLVRDGQRLVPSVTRVFSATRPVHVFAEAYVPDATTSRTLVAFVSVFRDGTPVLDTERLVLMSGAGTGGRAVPVHLTLPPGVLAPGAYDVQLTVLAPDAARAAFRRGTVLIVP
ncbi:MAG: VWA domain-containing protein [Vicinamibacterales bacterium]